ncbi:MAG: hypothetical protein OHK93_005994 [Ramalina farinacea]|uniref:P-loop containing nucleoside triphosphate hydrolase protein n=1 Tax=Ramalina farinacea TaxID=258253 RepID=A0AA43QHN7_9LECA|nr:hypothetical protein [Ramalina farinacea]
MTEIPPARPQLGHNVLAAAESFIRSHPPRSASTGCARIDEQVLKGGFRYGEVTSVAGGAGSGKTLVGRTTVKLISGKNHQASHLHVQVALTPSSLCTDVLPSRSVEGSSLVDTTKLAYHAAASHLLAPSSQKVTGETGDVVIIDTNGSFSPLRLRDVFVYRLRARAQREAVFKQSGYVYQKQGPSERVPEDGLMAEATKLLDRVRVMRVFDLAGVAEAVGEVSEITDRSRSLRVEGPQEGLTPPRRRGAEVEDSEEELEEDEEERRVEVTGYADAGTTFPGASEGPIGMVIIDTIANVVSSLVNKSQTQGQALLVTLMRSLRHLTALHCLCTILTNAAVGTSADSGKNPNFQYEGPADNASLFASTLGRPALGKTFSYLIDTSIFLSSVPKLKDDAIVAFGQTGERRWRNAQVIEILKDRSSAREGQWLGFEIADGVKLTPC